MTDYTELVKALRHCSHDGLVKCNECKYGGKEWPVGCEEEMMRDAAAAIEALEREVEDLTDANRWLKEGRSEDLNLLPKRGEWIKHPEVKNIYGGICVECPVCGDHFVVLNVSDEKYCRSCGAKMEVQDEA